MKISIAWLFDHINADKNTINVSHLVERFNQVTAEIEGCEKVELPINAISLAQIITNESESTLAESITLKTVIAKSTEWGIECSLPYRTDSCIGNWFLIYKNNDDTYRWVTIADIGGQSKPSVTRAQFANIWMSPRWNLAILALPWVSR